MAATNDAGPRPLLDKELLSEKLEEMGGAARETIAEMKSKAVKLEDAFEDAVRERPVRSVLIAVGVGALVGVALGALLRRK